MKTNISFICKIILIISLKPYQIKKINKDNMSTFQSLLLPHFTPVKHLILKWNFCFKRHLPERYCHHCHIKR